MKREDRGKGSLGQEFLFVANLKKLFKKRALENRRKGRGLCGVDPVPHGCIPMQRLCHGGGCAEFTAEVSLAPLCLSRRWVAGGQAPPGGGIEGVWQVRFPVPGNIRQPGPEEVVL